MKYLVFIIYGVVVWQLIADKPAVKRNGMRKGRHFYRISGIVNLIIGFAGMGSVNVFLRDKGIIPQFFVWSALVGFALMIIYGLYCIFRMIVSAEP